MFPHGVSPTWALLKKKSFGIPTFSGASDALNVFIVNISFYYRWVSVYILPLGKQFGGKTRLINWIQFANAVYILPLGKQFGGKTRLINWIQIANDPYRSTSVTSLSPNEISQV